MGKEFKNKKKSTLFKKKKRHSAITETATVGHNRGADHY